jgi:hypothetical protein
MRNARFPTPVLFILGLAAAACSLPGSIGPGSGSATATRAGPATETRTPSATAIPQPTFTPTLAILPLEIVEWSEWPYAHPADPSNTDTHVEVLIRNPNDFPVRVNRDEDELRFVDAAGEVVYTNPSPFFYIWQGEWMLPGETAALSACVCFWTSGELKQDWESLELTTPLEVATGLAYTLDVEVTAEFVLLEEVVHGYSGPGAATTLTNTSDQVLESIAFRVLAYDTGGRFVGVAVYGNAVASFTENIGLQPGDTASGLEDSQIDYMGNQRLTYEVAAIGIPAGAAATEEFVWPDGSTPGEWNGIPIMPDAIGNEVFDNEYQYATQADFDEIVHFYETGLTDLGFEIETVVDESGGTARVDFRRGDTAGEVEIAPYADGIHAVVITLSP